MKLLVLHVFLFISGHSWCQTLKMNLYQTSVGSSDTTLFVTIQKNSNGILFVFPYQEGETYYIVKKDSTMEKHKMEGTQAIYGPYKFKNGKGKILFQDKNIGRNYRVLYELSLQEHLAPHLFSSSTDGYTVINKLLDSTSLVQIGSSKVKCLRFFQTFHPHSTLNQILFVDKNTLTPCRIEIYNDRQCKELRKTIFAKTYWKS